MSIFFFIQDLPSHCSLIRNRPSHAWHADSALQTHKSLHHRAANTWLYISHIYFYVAWNIIYIYIYVCMYIYVSLSLIPVFRWTLNRYYTCCIIWGNSVQRVFLPFSSKIFSSVMSWSATKVVSSMSSPAWFANVKTGNACRSHVTDYRWEQGTTTRGRKSFRQGFLRGGKKRG